MKAPLSTNALRLLRTLHQEGAYGPAWAVTDARLAELTDLPVRTIIDLARELLEAKILIIALCHGKKGRFLVRPGDDSKAVQVCVKDYLKTLHSRAIGNHDRYRLVKDAWDCYELARRQGYDGQLTLDLPGDAA